MNEGIVVAINGNVLSGHVIYGPFLSVQAARAWLLDAGEDCRDWTLAPLGSPQGLLASLQEED